jgi:U3 small nucleolar RNA-associated protein MPP10
MFAPPTARALVARSELNPEEAQAARLKRKREKKADRKKLGEMAELYGKRRGSVKEEKERAMQNLVKTGKGVTVVGKSAKEQGKAGRRAVAAQETRTDSKRLKL